MALFNNRFRFGILPGMTKLTDYASYADVQKNFSSAKLWELFEGSRERLNIAHECIDRHAARANPAVIVVHADGSDEMLTFREIADASSRFAHYLTGQGVQAGDRVAIMLEPSRAFYTAVFGTMKLGAIAVPLFTLFGPDGVKLRIDDCSPRLIVTNAQKAPGLAGIGRVVHVDGHEDVIGKAVEKSGDVGPPAAGVPDAMDAASLDRHEADATRRVRNGNVIDRHPGGPVALISGSA